MLTSWSFIAMYVAAVGAVVLNLGRRRWGDAGWYLMGVGVVAAIAVQTIESLLRDHAARNRWGQIVILFVSFVIPLGLVPFVIGDDLRLGLGLMSMSAIFLWAMLGTLFNWPGFRGKRRANECRARV